MTNQEYSSMTERQLVGRKARTLRQLSNRAGVVIPKGRVVTIVRKYGGLEVRASGRAGGGSVTRVEPQAVELLP